MAGTRVTGPAADQADDADRAPFTAGIRVYLQVADRLEQRIRAGEFGEDGRLPLGPDLAAHYGVSMTVVDAARAQLAGRGLVVTVPGRGSYVRRGGRGSAGN